MTVPLLFTVLLSVAPAPADDPGLAVSLAPARPDTAVSFQASSLAGTIASYRPFNFRTGSWSSSGAFLAELAGGVVESAAGLGIGYVVSDLDECNAEDLECGLTALGVMGLTGTAGSALGAYLVGHGLDSRPS